MRNVVWTLTVLWLWPAWAAAQCLDPYPGTTWQSQMPDRSDVARALKDQYPAEWDAMNTQGDLRYIRRLAWMLHQQDPRWGLNGKRGTDVLSEDVLAYLNPTVVNDGRPGVEAVDFVLMHGSPQASVGWLNITCPTNQGGSGAKWIKPEPVGGTPPPPPQCPTCPPDLSKELAQARAELEQAKADLLLAVQALAQTVTERDAALARADREQQRADAAEAALVNVRCELRPPWLVSLGVRCKVVK